MASRIQNLTVDQGATFHQTFALTNNDGNPIDFNGYTVEGQVRKTYSSLTSTEMNAAIANSVLVLDMSANTTSSLEPGRFVYDVEITDPIGNVIRLLEGVVTVKPDVTR